MGSSSTASREAQNRLSGSRVSRISQDHSRPQPAFASRSASIRSPPYACRHCGSAKIRKLDEKITETLELAPERWKVIQHVREVFTCLECEKIMETQILFDLIQEGDVFPQSAAVFHPSPDLGAMSILRELSVKTQWVLHMHCPDACLP